jgi:hypothetical protein
MVDLSRVERMLNTVIESVKQLKLSIETKSTRLNAAMLRQQTLGTVMPDPFTSAQADFSQSERYCHPDPVQR